MQIYYIIAFFILGLCFGSFYNVVGYRLPKKQSLLKPNSHCPKCNHELKWYELIPVFSFLFLKGKCHECHKKIPVFYPIIELITGILFAVSYYSFDFSLELVIALVLSSLFSIIIVTDLNYLIIPDELIIISSIIIVIVNFINLGFLSGLKMIGYGLIIFLVMYLLMKIGNKIFKKESLGGGDIKLMFVLGMTMPLMMSIFSIFIASFIALPVSIVILLKNKDNVVPFGPFLVAGSLFVLFLKLDMDKIFSFLY